MYSIVKPVLFSLDPETAHNLTFKVCGISQNSLIPLFKTIVGNTDPRLELKVGGIEFQAPVGLAAGLDKNGMLVRLWDSLGFGAVELGTVTAIAQSGNPRPRLFRIPEHEALINRMGFNNNGSDHLMGELRKLNSMGWTTKVPIGVNLGKSKGTPLESAVADYRQSAERVTGLCDYLVVNVSSPNTPGLRKLQQTHFLRDILLAVIEVSEKTPVFLKLSPDLSREALLEAVLVAKTSNAAGIIASNTSIDHRSLADVGNGGLSGKPVFQKTLETVSWLSEETDLPIIGVGGVSSAREVLELLAVGAAATQLYTALIYRGPFLIRRIHSKLSGLIRREGFADLSTLINDMRSMSQFNREKLFQLVE
ncbi:MAG: quinone-dependent dihydroorotate dehydrogenase [Myxococcota bacterium]|nr:quinone-dependent dihydroorotate dehydrogenase [Myxococcota bacterium]